MFLTIPSISMSTLASSVDQYEEIHNVN